MKRSLDSLNSYTLETTDKTKGKINDFLFDEKQWIVRYLEADFGNLFKSKKVLIPRVFLDTPQWKSNHFPVKLKNSEIDRCPDLDQHLPVSIKYEMELHKHYDIAPYWPAAYMGTAVSYYPPRPITVPSKVVTEEEVDSILRSFHEVKGYHIKAIDGKIGHIEDIIIDDRNWQIVYAIIDTSNWLPWSKKVMIPIDHMEKICYTRREVEIHLKTGAIKDAPEYPHADMISEDYEMGLYDFYSSSLVK